MSVSTATGPTISTTQVTFAATLIDEWIRAGVTDAVLCPGSRSTPFVQALVARSELRLHVRIDERGAGFFAIGLAMEKCIPAILCTTSGTAAAELHPSVIEAHQGGIPVLVCTADRPPALHHIGAPQTITQNRLFGDAVRWFCEPGVPRLEDISTWRSLAARAFCEAAGGPDGPGPVHLNLAFAEPLVGSPTELPPGRPDAQPWVSIPRAIDRPFDIDAEELASWVSKRGIVLVGGRGGTPDAVAALAERLAWPLLADPRSGCRRAGPYTVAAADAILRDPTVRSWLQPEVIIQLGDPWVSKVIAEYVREAAGAGAHVVVVDPFWKWVDPDRIVTQVIPAEPGEWAAAAVACLNEPSPQADTTWCARWASAEERAQRAIGHMIDTSVGESVVEGEVKSESSTNASLNEPHVARLVMKSLPEQVRLVISSSMPIRDVEWYGAPRDRPPAVFANRGANGIDGVASTAQGLAADGGGAVVALLGDLAFFHDVSSLVQPSKVTPVDGSSAAPSCTLVVIDNGGGGIFHFLPQVDALDPGSFETFFGTPVRSDVAEVARGFGLFCSDVSSASELRAAMDQHVGRPGLSVVCVRVQGRAENVAIHDSIHAAVRSEIETLLDGAGS